MTAPGVSREIVTRVAPLGIRCWDPATGTPAGSGLAVVASDADGRRSRYAGETASGVYVVRGVPGLSAAERGTGDDAYWQAPPAVGTYRIEITDPAGRYLPLRFTTTLPHRGLFRPACGFTGTPAWQPAPPTVPGAPPPAVVPLFTAPARVVPAGFAVVRAQLELAGSGSPASWALLQVIPPSGPTALGLADGAGRVVVPLPYPEPTGLDLVAPGAPGTASPALPDQTWTLGLRAYFGAPPGPGQDPIAGPTEPPDLCRLLDQRPAGLLATATGTPLTEVQLRYGRELVVRTAARSTLLLTPDSPA